MSGSKDGQSLFHRILPATASGLTSKTAINWYLKIKHSVQCCSYQKLLRHSQHAKNQLNSQTH